MHPVITQETHPQCYPTYQALLTCYKEHPMGRIFNKCRPFSQELDKCLQEEYDNKRKKNAQDMKNAYERVDFLLQHRAEQNKKPTLITAEQKVEALRKEGEKQ
jgi:hypothetical protein